MANYFNLSMRGKHVLTGAIAFGALVMRYWQMYWLEIGLRRQSKN